MPIKHEVADRRTERPNIMGDLSPFQPSLFTPDDGRDTDGTVMGNAATSTEANGHEAAAQTQKKNRFRSAYVWVRARGSGPSQSGAQQLSEHSGWSAVLALPRLGSQQGRPPLPRHPQTAPRNRSQPRSWLIRRALPRG
jgi:hypothetical protein